MQLSAQSWPRIFPLPHSIAAEIDANRRRLNSKMAGEIKRYLSGRFSLNMRTRRVRWRGREATDREVWLQ